MNLTPVFYAAPPPSDAPLRSGKGATRLFLAAFLPLTLALILDAVLNFKWRMFHDYPTMAYYGFLMNVFHKVPYRDFVEMNMPGNHFFNALTGRIFGYTDLGFRILDMTVLSALLASTALWLGRLGWKVAWAGMAAFVFLYFGNGPIISLQREYLLLVPISLSLWAATASESRFGPAWRSLLIGLLCGAAFLIKPHIVIGYPVIFLLLIAETRARDQGKPWFGVWTLRLAAVSTAGFIFPLLLTAAYLWKVDALQPFLEIARNYWPLYGEMTGGHAVVSHAERMAYLWSSYWEFNGLAVLFWPAALGGFIAWANAPLLRPRRRLMLALLLLTVLYSIYPVLAGKFWPYHWLIFMYFLCALGALCFAEQPKPTRALLKIFPPLVFLWTSIVPSSVWSAMGHQLRGEVFYQDKIARGDAIAAYLRKHLAPGDTVQPLDWTGGSHQAMLAVGAELATPFLVDACFYHHVSNPYIQGLRKRFIDSLSAVRPRFIIQVLARDLPSGPDTSPDFPELQDILSTRYRRAAANYKLGFVIYERKSVPAP